MPDLLDIHLFNQESPFDSLIDFTNNHQFIKESSRKRFYESLQAFFTEYAFKDISTKKRFEERLDELDLPRLFHSMKLDLGDCCEAGYHQLLANISKVTGHFFSKDSSEDAVYQVCAPSSKNLVFWGWIPKSYVDASSRLQTWLNRSNGTIELEDLKPSVLVALQRFQYFKIRSDNVDLSLEALLDLYSFAKDYDIAHLKEELVTLFQSLDLKEKDRAELEELLPEYVIDDRYQRALQSTSDATRSLVRHQDENSLSEWFDEKDPYRSIAQFTNRCCTLPPEELPRFLSTVDTFFSQAAIPDKRIAVPMEMRERFARIDLPFLLATYQTSASFERKRFIAAVQKVTGLAFFQLKERDRLHLIQNTYGDESLPKNEQTTWISVREAKQCQLVPAQTPSEDEFDRGFADVTPHTIRLRQRYPLPLFTVDEEKGLQYESPEQLIHFLCLALDYKVESWVKKVCLTLEEASKIPAKWEKCSQLLASHLGREDVCQALELHKVPSLTPDFENLDSNQLWDYFAYRVGDRLENREEVKKCFFDLDRDRQLKALQYADSFSSRDPSNLVNLDELVEKLCLALDLSLKPYVQKTSKEIRDLSENSAKWTDFSTGIAPYLERERVFLFMQEAKVPLLTPQVSKLNEELYNVFRFNMLQHGLSPEEAKKVIDSTFGDSSSKFPVLGHFKEEATPSQLQAINEHLLQMVIVSIPPETEGTVRECSVAVLQALTQPDFQLSAPAVAACVQKHANPRRTKNLQRNIYELLTNNSMNRVFEKYHFSHIQNALQEAYETSFVADGLDDVIESDSLKEKVRAQFNELIEVLCEDSSSAVKYRLKTFKSTHYLSDEDKLQLAKFWQAQGVSIAHKGHILSKQQVWDALCTVYRTDVNFLIDHVKTHFLGNEKAQKFLLDNLKYLTYGSGLYRVKSSIQEHQIEAKEAKDVLDFIGGQMPDHLTVSKKRKKYLSCLTEYMLALYIPSIPEHEGKILKWMSSFLKKMGETEDDHHVKVMIAPLSDDQVLEAGEVLQHIFGSWNNTFAQEIKQIIWNRFCNIYDADLLHMVRDINVKATSRTFLESVLKKFKEKETPQDDREIVAQLLDTEQISFEETENLSRQLQAYMENPSSENAKDRIARICKRLIDSLNIWFEQENIIQKFLTHLPKEDTDNALIALRYVIRRTFRTPPTRYWNHYLTAAETLTAAKFLQSQDETLECKGKKATAPEVWSNFCESHKGDASLLRETVLQMDSENAQIRDFLAQALEKYRSLKKPLENEDDFHELLGPLCKNLSPEKLGALKGHLEALSRESFVTKPLQEFLSKIADHVTDHIVVLMEIEKLRREFKESDAIWLLISYLFNEKYGYTIASMPRDDFSELPLKSKEEKQKAISFFQEALAKEEDSPRTTLLKGFWEQLCSKHDFESLLIEVELSKQPELETLITKIEKEEGFVETALEEQDVVKVEAFFAHFVRNNNMLISDVVKKYLSAFFLKELWKPVQKRKITSTYAEMPRVQKALLYSFDNDFPLRSRPPLTEAEMQQAAQFWQEEVDPVPTGLKLLKKLWNNFCKVYDTHDLFLRRQIDTQFSEQENVAEFLKKICKTYTCYSYYLDEDHQTELKEKIAKAVRKFAIGRAEARAIQEFLKTEVQKAPYVSKVLEKATGQFVQLMGEIQNITQQANQFEDLEIRQAIIAIMDQLCLAEEPEFKTLAEKYPLNAEQMQRAVDALEQSTEDIPCLDRVISPKQVAKAFCGVYAPHYLRSTIEAHFSKQKSCKNFLFNIFQNVEGRPSDFLEPPHFEGLVAKQCQEFKIGLQEVEALKSFLEGERRKTLFLAQDETTNATASKLIDHFTAIIERHNAANRFLGDAFKAAPSVHHAMELVIDRILVNKAPDELLTPLEKDVPLTNEQKLAVAEFLENEKAQLIYQERTISAEEIWRVFCKAYSSDSIPMVKFIKEGQGFEGQDVLIKIVEDLVQDPSYLDEDKTDEFNKRVSAILMSSEDAQNIQKFLEEYPQTLRTEKLSLIIFRLTEYMASYIKRASSTEAYQIALRHLKFR